MFSRIYIVSFCVPLRIWVIMPLYSFLSFVYLSNVYIFNITQSPVIYTSSLVSYTKLSYVPLFFIIFSECVILQDTFPYFKRF